MDDQDGWLKDLSKIFNGEIWKDNGIFSQWYIFIFVVVFLSRKQD